MKTLNQVLTEIINELSFEYVDRHREPSLEEDIQSIKDTLKENGFMIVAYKED
jgi:hypothetical protein